MGTTIDSLELEVQSSSQNAEKGLDALVNTLGRLKTATTGSAGLNKVNKTLTKLDATLKGMNSQSITKMRELASALGGLSSMNGIKLSSTVAKTIESIGAASSKLNGQGISSLRELTPALSSLSSMGNVKISPTIASSLTKITEAVNKMNIDNLGRVEALANAIGTLSKIQNIKISSSIANQIVRLAEAAEKLKAPDLTKFGNLAEELVPLTNLGKITAFSELAKLPKVMEALNTLDMTAFETKIKQLASALQPLTSQMSQIGSVFSRFPSSIRSVTTSTNALSTANTRAGDSYMNLAARISMAVVAVKTIAQKIVSAINQSNQYIEDLNLFNASMGMYTQAAQQYAEKVADVMGLDPGEWMRNQGIFMTLATGFGVVGDRAYTMSKNLTQLGYDISSFFNIGIEDAMQKLQSGISGELEPLRRLGYDLSQARLKAIALSLGIDKTFNSMTQAEKAQLRYYAIMTQVTHAQGDMARTLDSPKNQLRVFQATVTQAARAVGNIFIPILNAVLPVAIAVAKAIQFVASAIASLFGFVLPSVDYSDAFENMGGGAGDLADNLDKAGGSAKKLKSYLMGFDELNVLNDDNTSGGGGSGGGGGGGFDFELPEYDFIGNAVSARVDAIMQKIQPFLDWIKEHLDEILSCAEAIGAAILMWKVAKSLIPDLGTIRGDLSNILGAAVSVGTIVVMASLVYNFDNKYMESGKFGYLIADGLSTALSSFIVGKVMKTTYGGQAGYYSAAATVAVSALTSIKAIYDNVSADGFSGEAVGLGIVSAIKGAFAGGIIAKALGVSLVAGAGIGFAVAGTLAITATLIGISVQKNNVKMALAWGKVALTAEEQRQFAESMFDFDVKSTINVIDATIENEETARQNLEAKITEFNSGLNLIKLGVTVDDSAGKLSAMQEQLTGTNGIIPSLQSLIDSQQKTIELSVSLVPPKDAEGNDLSTDLATSIGLSSEMLNQTALSIGKSLSEYISKGITDGLTDNEKYMIAELSGWLNRIETAVAQGKISGEFGAGMNILLSDLTKESFSGVLDSYQTMVDELSESYTKLEKQAYADAVAYAAGLTEAKAYYDSIGDTVNAEKTQQALDQVNLQIENWDIASSVEAATNAAIEPGRQSLISAMQDIFGTSLTDIEDDFFLSQWLNTFMTVGDAEQMTIDEACHAFSTVFYESLQNSMSKDDYKIFMQASDTLGITGWDILTTDTQTQLYSSMEQLFGSQKTYEIFQQLGYDLSGVLATGIANGSVSIVSATQDTITLMSDTLGQKTLEITPQLLSTFSNLGIDLSGYLAAGMESGKTGVATAANNLGTEAGNAAATAFENATPPAVTAATSAASQTSAAYLTTLENGLTEGQSGVTTAAQTAASGVNTTISNTIDTAQTTMTTGVETACSSVTSNVNTTAADGVSAIEAMANTLDSTVATTASSVAVTFGTLCSNIVKAFEGTYTSVTSTWTQMPSWFLTSVKTPISNAVALLQTEMQTKFTTAKTMIQMTWNTIPAWFTTSVKTPLTNQFTLLQTDIQTKFTSAKTNVQQTWTTAPSWFTTNVKNPLTNVFSLLQTDIQTKFLTSKTNTQTHWSTVPSWFTTNVKTPIESMFSLLQTDIQTKMGTAKTNTQTSWQTVPSWFTTNVKNPIITTFEALGSGIGTAFSSAKSNAQNAWNGMPDWFKTNIIDGIISKINNAGWYGAGQNAANGFKNGLKSVSMPNFHISWSTKSKTVNGQTVRVPFPNLSFYAEGGFPTAGQLFVAREAGAELVGNIGGKTAVANNDQIVEAVSQGVYLAVRDAMSEGDNTPNVNVYLDGETLYKNQQKVAKNKGYQFAK